MSGFIQNPDRHLSRFGTLFHPTGLELPWKTYTGSCKPLNEDIKNGDLYTKEILRFCNSKKQLTYYELKELFCNGTIEREDCYNGNIMGKLFPSDLKN